MSLVFHVICNSIWYSGTCATVHSTRLDSGFLFAIQPHVEVHVCSSIIYSLPSRTMIRCFRLAIHHMYLVIYISFWLSCLREYHWLWHTFCLWTEIDVEMLSKMVSPKAYGRLIIPIMVDNGFTLQPLKVETNPISCLGGSVKRIPNLSKASKATSMQRLY